MPTDFLYHGSPFLYDILIPHQAVDIAHPEGCHYAVYATSNKNMAICFSMGCVENSPNQSSRYMEPELGDFMYFDNCHPNYGEYGYLYYLDKSSFQNVLNSQWISLDPVIPLKVEKIAVNDYLHLCKVIESN